MNAALLTPSKYIKAVQFSGKEVTLTIAGVKLEELVREDKTKEKRGVVSFQREERGWILNTTNAKCLIALFGGETNAWIGKRITLYPEANEMSDTGVAIRVRGSPDIERDLRFVLKLARKKPRTLTLKRTVPGQATVIEDEPAVDEEPPHDPATGEVIETKPRAVDVPALLARFAACADPATLRTLKDEAKAAWPNLAADARPQIKAAVDSATARLETAAPVPTTTQAPTVETPAEAEAFKDDAQT